jgi:uncharacterized glyoxalase superfamily protein PhnB
MFLSVAERVDVDRLFQAATTAGYRTQKSPEDAFRGARYAIVEDPDGHAIGFMSESIRSAVVRRRRRHRRAHN